MRLLRTGLAIGAVLASLVTGATAAAAAGATTCTGGAVAPGTYASLAVSGACSIPSGTVNVQGNLTILPGAGLDVSSQSARLVVNGNVYADRGSTFLLGCDRGDGCQNVGNQIRGSLFDNGGAMLTIYQTAINGSLNVQGGGGDGVFSTYEDSTIGGSATVNGYTGRWLGFLRNRVGGAVTFTNNGSSIESPFSNIVGSNVIGGSLSCSGNTPAPHLGAIGLSPNEVGGPKLGQCAGL